MSKSTKVLNNELRELLCQMGTKGNEMECNETEQNGMKGNKRECNETEHNGTKRTKRE